MIEAYKTNRALRETYLRTNAVTHAEIWDTEEGYKVYLCTAPGIGYPESPEFCTVGQCRSWLKTFCPEIHVN